MKCNKTMTSDVMKYPCVMCVYACLCVSWSAVIHGRNKHCAHCTEKRTPDAERLPERVSYCSHPHHYHLDRTWLLRCRRSWTCLCPVLCMRFWPIPSHPQLRGWVIRWPIMVAECRLGRRRRYIVNVGLNPVYMGSLLNEPIWRMSMSNK